MWRVSYVLEISRQTERSVCHPLPVASQDPKRKRRKKNGYGSLRFCVARDSSRRLYAVASSIPFYDPQHPNLKTEMEEDEERQQGG